MQLKKVGLESQSLRSSGFENHHRSSASTKESAEKKTNVEKVINTDEVRTVVTKLNEFMEPTRTNLQFKYHEELNEYYVTVVNPLTNEVVKEIPPKKMLDMFASMVEFMGILIDEKI